MKLIFTNGFGNKGEIQKTEIDIKGKCVITNYDTRTYEPSKAGDLTVTVDGKNSTVQKGATIFQEDNKTVNMNNKKYSIFTALAGIDGNASDLTEKDIEKAKTHCNKQDKTWQALLSLGVTEIRYDKKAGVATIVIGEDELLRIDFETKKERKNTKKAELPKEDPVPEESDKEKSVVKKLSTKDSSDFLKDLRNRESTNKPNVINKQGYAGLYQMGEQALADIGVYKKDGKYNNDWKGTFVKNEFGISSLQDFLNDVEKQNKAQVAFKKKQWGYIKHYRLEQFVGQTINGQEITTSGLLAGAHLVGVKGLKKYLESNGEQDVKDGNNVSVSEYIRDFADYDMSDITSTTSPKKTENSRSATNKNNDIKKQNTVKKEEKQNNITPKYKNHEIKSGETLYRIAYNNGCTVEDLKLANNLQDNHIKPGMVLKIPTK